MFAMGVDHERYQSLESRDARTNSDSSSQRQEEGSQPGPCSAYRAPGRGHEQTISEHEMGIMVLSG